MKLLVLIDRPNWAYHSIAKGLQKYMEFDYLPIKNGVDKIKKVYKKYDRFLVMGYQTAAKVDFLPRGKTLVGVHGHHAWDNRKTTPEEDVEPPRELVDYLKSFAGVNVVSKRLHKLFPFAVYTPNGVDTDVFKPTKPLRTGNDMVVGCTGSKKHDWRKGLSDFIVPAAQRVGLKVKPAWKDVPMDEMPAYYNSIDVYVCASSSEGMSLGVLEAMACARPVISTWPCEQWVYECKRTVDDIALGLENNKGWPTHEATAGWYLSAHVTKWSWKVRHKAWKDFLYD